MEMNPAVQALVLTALALAFPVWAWSHMLDALQYPALQRLDALERELAEQQAEGGRSIYYETKSVAQQALRPAPARRNDKPRRTTLRPAPRVATPARSASRRDR